VCIYIYRAGGVWASGKKGGEAAEATPEAGCNGRIFRGAFMIWYKYKRKPGCPGSVPCGAAGWPAAGGMANGVVRLALAKSR